MRLILLFVFIGIALCAPKETPKTKGVATQSATVQIFGTEFTLPDWMNKARITIIGFCDKVSRFFSGDMAVSTQVFGKKVSFRTNIPETKEEASKSITRFFSNVKTDSATRIIFVIYVNLVVLFVAYTLLFVKQVQLHRKQQREQKIAKKQRKMDEEERRWMASSKPGPEDIPLIANRYPDIQNMSPETEVKRSSDIGSFETSVEDLGIEYSRQQRPRLLLPELFSPAIVHDIDEAEEAELSLQSTQSGSHSSEVDCEVEVYNAVAE